MPPTPDCSLDLSAVGRTAVAALRCRAHEQNRDPAARLLHDSIAADHLEKLGNSVPHFDHAPTQVAVCHRARVIDGWVSGWLTQHPDGVVVELGVGLSTRHARLNLRPEQTLGLDRPRILNLRRSLGHTGAMAAADFIKDRWLDETPPWPRGRPVCFVAEGLLMYLPQSAVERLFVQLARACPSAMTCFDAYAPAAKLLAPYHRGLRQTGASLRSTFTRSAHLEMLETSTLRDDAAAFRRLPWIYRLPGVHRLHATYRARLIRVKLSSLKQSPNRYAAPAE